MSSRPPASCCTQGFKHEGEPTGVIIKIQDKWTAYVAAADGKQKRAGVGVLLVPDVMSISNNVKLLADEFASHGFTCMALDIFNGDALTLNDLISGRDVAKWLREGSDGHNPHTPEVIDPIVSAAIETLRTDYGASKIASVGYCLGAKYTIRFLKSSIDIGYVAHPSNVTDEELAAINGPLSIAAAEKDHIFQVEDRHRSEAILSETGKPFQIFLYSGTAHGFAVRGNMKDKSDRENKEQALQQAVAWFDRFL